MKPWKNLVLARLPPKPNFQLMSESQRGILSAPPTAARYMTWTLRPGANPTDSLKSLAALGCDDSIVVGLGQSTVAALGKKVDGLRPFPEHTGVGVEVPSTPGSLWVYLRGSDRGELLHRGREVEAAVIEAYELRHVVDGFKYKDSRDLSGYVDGTENPTGERANEAALTTDGSSFVAMQQWEHDLDTFLSFDEKEQDDIIGRHKRNNEEFDAPDFAHVKRTAQESFTPEAFLLRRSLPWSEGQKQGLVFIAFGKSFDAFEAQLSRMTGEEDGIVDGLFKFSRPVTGSFFWCPPVKDGSLDLSSILD